MKDKKWNTIIVNGKVLYVFTYFADSFFAFQFEKDESFY